MFLVLCNVLYKYKFVIASGLFLQMTRSKVGEERDAQTEQEVIVYVKYRNNKEIIKITI